MKFKKGDFIQMVKGAPDQMDFLPCARLIVDVKDGMYQMQVLDDILASKGTERGYIYSWNTFEVDMCSEIMPLPNDILKGML